MKVTDIKPAVKTPGRWNIFIAGKYAFSLSDSQLLDEKLKRGGDIDEARLAELKGESEFGKAYARALELIFRRLRSEKEVRDYARRKEWPDELRDRIIAKLIKKGYINDKKFAESWVRSRTAIKPSSRRKLELELRQKGVASSVISDALQEDGEHDEQAALQKIIAKKRARYDDEQKFMAYLARQGFSFEAIKAALAEE